MRARNRHLTAAIVAGAIGTASPLGAQPASGPVYDSYRRAHEIVERALEAHGGAAAIRGLKGIDYRYSGITFDRDQGMHASAAFDSLPPRRPVSVRAAVDFANPRFLSEFGIDAPGEGRVATRSVQRGREVLRFSPLAAGDARTFSRDSLPPGAPTAFPFQQQLMPVLVLRQAIVRSPTLRFVGRRSAGGVDADIVSFSNADGSVLAFGVDARTGLVNTVETIGEFGLFGDIDHVWRFSEYELNGGLRIPRAFQHRVNGLLQEDMRLVSITVNPEWTDSTFAPPSPFVEQPARSGSSGASGPRVVKGVGSIHFVEGLSGYRLMFADAGDGIVVVEAPVNARVAAQAIALIEQTIPGKPISHIVLTHHHLDHVGGLRPFVERGAIVVVPPGMEEYIRRVLSAPRSIGLLGQPPRASAVPTIEVVTARRRFGTLEVIHTGSNSHVGAMLVAFAPSERLLFQADLFQVTEGEPSARASQAARDLLDIIRKHELDVQTIGSVHGRHATIDELRKAVEGTGSGR